MDEKKNILEAVITAQTIVILFYIITSKQCGETRIFET